MRVLVSGANRGLGLEFVRQLLARGDAVIAACRDPAAATALASLAATRSDQLQVLALDQADAASIAQFARSLVQRGECIDLLLNNAGMLPAGERFGAIDPAVLAATLATNASGPFLLTQALAPLLADGAKVVNLSSGLGSIAGVQDTRTPSYAISKAALNMATRQLAAALRERGICVVAVSPGWVRTAMGGAEATLSAEQSVHDLLALIDRLGVSDSGQFLTRLGEAIAW